MPARIDTAARLTGACHVAAGPLLAAAYVAHPHLMDAPTLASATWVWIHLGFVLSLILGLFAVAGLYWRHVESLGALGHAGYALASAGLFLIGGLAYVETFMIPTLAAEFPAVVERYGAADTMGPIALMFPLAGAMAVLGYALLGGAFLRLPGAPRAPFAALIVAALLFGFGLSPLGGLTAASVGGVVFGASLTWLGVLQARRGRLVG